MMNVYYDLTTYHPPEGGACVALGFFDGVHRGHRAVIGACAEDSGSLPCVVLTFRESPSAALGRPTLPLLTANARKAALMEEAGADAVIFADFLSVKDLSPADFVQSVLCDRLNAKKVFCGFNYRFGKDGAGDTNALQTLCREQGIAVSVTDPVFCDGEQVSSTKIRERIAAGDVARANTMLGYRYAVEGVIDSGNGIGSVMGFPTVNLPMEAALVVPRFGVYASQVCIGGVRYRGATNIGVHPTVGANDAPLCETFLLDFKGGDLYGKRATCELKAFVREEKRFDSVDALTAQVKQDCETILHME